MSKVIFLNGSPKKRKAVTEKLLDIVKSAIGSDIEAETLYIYEEERLEDICEKIYSAERVIMAQPLYIDCLPARVLELMESYGNFVKDKQKKKTELYFIINCGFLENSQNNTAIRILETFAQKTGLDFRGGISVGSGAIILGTDKRPELEVMLSKLGKELSEPKCREKQCSEPKCVENSNKSSFHKSSEKNIMRIDAALPKEEFIALGDGAWLDAGGRRGLTKEDLSKGYY